MSVDLYIDVEKHLENKLPFVIYRKPDGNMLHAFLQQDNILHFEDDYTASGFVFSPFDSSRQAILLPTQDCVIKKDLVPKSIKNKKEASLASHNEDLSAKIKYRHLVEEAVKTIQTSEIKKIVISRSEKITSMDLNPIDIFNKLVVTYPQAFVYCWYHPKVGMWLGATPETLLKVKKGHFFTMALAGTQPYTGTIDVDWGVKEVEEQAIVTRYILKKLSQFSKSISTSKTYTRKAGNILHLCTDIEGHLDQSFQLKKLIEKLHPTPAVCGLPKDKAKQFIEQYERYNRDFYAGFLGELNIKNENINESNLYVNLRCMQYKPNESLLYVGGGITKESIPEKEWEETVKKTQTIKKVLF